MGKLELTDNAMSTILKMAEGNPGAVAAMTSILKETPEIDPQSLLGGMGLLLSFDDLGIYGTDIYVLWSDKCNKDTRKLNILMRAHQLGFVPTSKIVEMAKDQMYKIDLTGEEWEDIEAKVLSKLEKFQRKENV